MISPFHMQMFSGTAGHQLASAVLAVASGKGVHVSTPILLEALQTGMISPAQETALLEAVRVVEESGPPNLKSVLSQCRAGEWHQVSMTETIQSFTHPKAPPQSSFQYAFISHIGPTRIFSLPMGRTNTGFRFQIILIFPNWNRIYFETVSIGSNGSARIEVSPKGKWESFDGSQSGVVDVRQDPRQPNAVTLYHEDHPFLLLGLTEELRHQLVDNSARRVLVRRESLYRVGDAPVFNGDLPNLHVSTPNFLGHGAIQVSSMYRTGLSRHRVDLFFSDGSLVRLRFSSGHHVGSQLAEVAASLHVPTSEGDEKRLLKTKFDWKAQKGSGTISIPLGGHSLEVDLRYSTVGSGNIDISDVRLAGEAVSELRTDWAPPTSVPTWLADVEESEETDPEAAVVETGTDEKERRDPEPFPEEDRSGLLFEVGSVLKTGGLQKVHDHAEVGFHATYGSDKQGWKVDVDFGKGKTEKDTIVNVGYRFPGESGSMRAHPISLTMEAGPVKVSGGHLLFFPDGGRYRETVFFLPNGTHKGQLFEVTPFANRLKGAGEEGNGAEILEETTLDEMRLLIVDEIFPKLEGWRREMAGALQKAITQKTDTDSPAVATVPAKKEVKLDPLQILLESLEGEEISASDAPEIIHFVEEGEEFQVKMLKFKPRGFPRILICNVNGSVFGSYQRDGIRQLLVGKELEEGGVGYLYCLGLLYGVVFRLDLKRNSIREISSRLVRMNALGKPEKRKETGKLRQEVTPAQLEKLRLQGELIRFWEQHRSEIVSTVKYAHTVSIQFEFGEDLSGINWAIEQAKLSSPVNGWFAHLPRELHGFFGPEVMYHDIDTALKQSPAPLFNVDRFLFREIEEASWDTNKKAVFNLYLAGLVGEALHRLVVGRESPFLEWVLFLKKEGVRTGAAQDQLFLERLVDYLFGRLIDHVDAGSNDEFLVIAEKKEVVRQSLSLVDCFTGNDLRLICQALRASLAGRKFNPNRNQKLRLETLKGQTENSLLRRVLTVLLESVKS